MIVAGYLLAAMALLGVLAMTAWSYAHAGQRHPLMHDGPVIIMYTLGAWLFLLTSTRCRGLFIVSQRPPCTPGVDPEVKGNTTMFTYERALPMDGWSYDRAMRGEVARGRSCAIPTGKCQAPSMFKWTVPADVNAARVGALTVVFDGQGHPIDSICTEKPCTRFGTCG